MRMARRAHASVQASVHPTNLPGQVSELIGRDKELRRDRGSRGEPPARDPHWCRWHRQDTSGDGGGPPAHAAIRRRRLGRRLFVTVRSQPGSGHDRRGGRCGSWRNRHEATRGASTRCPTAVAGARHCEHVVGAMAAMAEELLRAGAAAQIIATSREPLRAEGEWIYPVLPLAVPAEELAMTTSSSMARCGCSSSGREPSSRISRRSTGRSSDRGDLPAARWHPAGDRAGGRANRGTQRRTTLCPSRRSLPPVDRRAADGVAAPSDPAGNARLEL